MESNNVLSLSLGEYIDKVNELKSKLEDLSKTSQDYKQVAEQLKNVNEQLNGSFSSFTENANKVSSSIGELVSGLSNLKDQFGNLNFNSDSLSDFVQQIDNIKNNLENLNISSDIVSKFDELKSSLEAISGTDVKINIDTDSITQFKADLEAVVDSISNLQTDIRVELNKDDIESFLKTLSDVQTQIEKLQNKLSDLRVNIDAEELQNVKEQIDNLSDKTVNLSLVSNVSEVVQNVNTELGNLSDKEVNIQVNTEINTDNLQEVQEQLDSIQDKTVSVNVDTNVDTDNIDKLTDKLDNISDKTVNIQVNTDADLSGIDEAENRINNIQDKTVSISFTDEDISRIYDDIADLNSRLDDISDKEVKTNVDSVPIDIAKERILELKEGIAELQAELDKTDTHSQEYQILSSQIDGLKADLKELIGDGVDPTIDSIANLTREIADMKSELNNLEIGSDRFVELSEKVREAQERLADLKDQMGDNAESVKSLSGAMTSALSDMGLGLGGLEKAFNAATVASNGFKAALDLLKAHPIIAVLTILLGILFKIKSAIENNEEASDAWKVAMAAFQPIVDAFNRALGWLAEGLAKVAQWMGEHLPDAIRFVSKPLNWLISIIGNVVEAFLFLPTVCAKVFDAVTNTFKKGISWIVGAVADLLDVVGLGDSLHKVERNIDNFTFNVGGSLEKFSGNVKSWFDNAGKSVENFGKKWAATTDTYIKKAKEMDALEDDIREQQVRNAESALKVAQLRKQAAEESDPKKRLEILKQVDAEIVKNGKEQVELAKRQYELAKWYADQAPNSEADNDRLARLKAAVAQTEATYTNSLVKISKQETALQEALKKQAEAKTEKEKKEAEKQVKEAEKALKEKLRLAQEYVKNYNTLISNIQTETSSKVAQVKSEKELIESMGLMTPDKAREYQNQMYQIQKEGLDRIIAETEKALASEEITEEQRLQLQVKYSSLIVQTITQENANKKELNKITLDEINKDTEDKLQELQDTYKKTDVISGYIDQLKDMAPKYQEQVLNALSLSDDDKSLISSSFEALSTDVKEKILDAMQIDSDAKQRMLENVSVSDEDKELILSNLQGLSKDVQTEILNMLNVDPAVKEQLITSLSITDEEKEQILESLRAYKDDKLSLDIEEEDQEHEHQMRMLEIQYERLQAIRDKFGEDSEYFKEAQQEYNEAYEAEEQRHSNAMIQLYDKTSKAARKSTKDQLNVTKQLMKGTANLMGGIADIMKANLDQKVENGEISEEEAEKEFERIKALQIAEATINTIEGAITAYTSAQSLGPIAGPIVGGINAAAVTAMGIAQIAQIKQQKYKSSGNLSSSSAGGNSVQTVDFQSVSVNPLLDQNRDLNSMTSLSETKDEDEDKKDQRVYILQSDIDDSQKQVEIRQNQSTF